MASSQTKSLRLPRQVRGQGVIETIVALPVFLFLICVLLQLFFLALAQVQLRYAAFCAARVGAVRDADIKEMEVAAGKVLSAIPGFSPVSPDSYRVEKLDLLNRNSRETEISSKRHPELIKIRVHLNYPLSLPFLDTLWSIINTDGFPYKTAFVPLHASWTTIKFGETSEKTSGKNQPRT
jgi:hypothetical protein